MILSPQPKSLTQRPASFTDQMLNEYNARLRAYVIANRGMDSLEFHTISGREMIEKFGHRAYPE